jgi:serine/threonine protein kinase
LDDAGSSETVAAPRGAAAGNVTSPRSAAGSGVDGSHRRRKLGVSRGRTKHRQDSSRPASPDEADEPPNNGGGGGSSRPTSAAGRPSLSSRRRANTMYEMRLKRPTAELLAAVAEAEAREKSAADAAKAGTADGAIPGVALAADAPKRTDSRTVQISSSSKGVPAPSRPSLAAPPAPSSTSSSTLGSSARSVSSDDEGPLNFSLPNQSTLREQSRTKLVHSVTDMLPPASPDDRGGAFALIARAFKTGNKKAVPVPVQEARYSVDFYSKTVPVRLLGELGRGGSMAVVHRACISEFMVACKVYNLEIMDDHARETVLREYRLVRALAPHENIIPYFALDQLSSIDHWRLYMPLYDMTLRQLLNESRACAMSRRGSAIDDIGGASWTSLNSQLLTMTTTNNGLGTHTVAVQRVLTVLERIEAARQIASALSHVHASQVLHRDVKAENVLVRLGVDELAQCVLCDFGEAREKPKAAGLERSMSCFPEVDHELLTERGFMSLADVEACETLPRVASFDAAKRQLVYEAPRAVVVNESTPALVEFINNSNNDGVCVVTPNHDMLVRRGRDAPFAKVRAEHLVGQRVDLLTRAWRGVDQLMTATPPRDRAQCHALGAALASGTTSALPHWLSTASLDDVGCVLDATGGVVQTQSATLRDQLVRVALHAGRAASFSADSGAWRVEFGARDDSEAMSVTVARVDHKRVVAQRSWCFSMPSGHVVVRRVVRDERGRVVRALPPTIQGNSNVGTSEFMAPETISTTGGRRMTYDEKSDIFSYGMLLFELITNEIPFRREQVSPFDLLDHIKAHARPEMPQGVINSRTEGLYQLHVECTQPDPIRRISAHVAHQRAVKLVAAERARIAEGGSLK